MGWQSPRNFYDNVSARGMVYVLREIGKVQEQNGEQVAIPLWLTFHTGKGSGDSPYGGRNFDIPFLAARIFPDVDEGRYTAVFPNGFTWRFWRDKKIPDVYNGSAGWKAELKGDVFQAFASCGTAQITFKRGKVQSFQDGDGRKFSYVYESNSGNLQEVTIDGQRAVRVLRGAIGTTEVTGLDLPLTGQKVTFEREERMIISKVSGKNLITEQVPALSKVTIQDTSITYAFAQDTDGNPTIEVGGAASLTKPSRAERSEPKPTQSVTPSDTTLIAWDTSSGKILRETKSDSDWKYDPIVDDPKRPWSSVPLGRSNTKGQKEFYFNDPTKGEQTILNIDGVKTIYTWFLAGPLAGKARDKTEVQPDGTSKVLWKNNFDENGKLFSRETNGVLETVAEYSKRIKGETSLKEQDPAKIKEKYLQLYSEAVNDRERERVVCEMALDLVMNAKAYDDAKKLLPLITNRVYLFSIQFNSINGNKDISSQEKVAGFQDLLEKFPEKKELLTSRIQKHSK